MNMHPRYALLVRTEDTYHMVDRMGGKRPLASTGPFGLFRASELDQVIKTHTSLLDLEQHQKSAIAIYDVDTGKASTRWILNDHKDNNPKSSAASFMPEDQIMNFLGMPRLEVEEQLHLVITPSEIYAGVYHKDGMILKNLATTPWSDILVNCGDNKLLEHTFQKQAGTIQCPDTDWEIHVAYNVQCRRVGKAIRARGPIPFHIDLLHQYAQFRLAFPNYSAILDSLYLSRSSGPITHPAGKAYVPIKVTADLAGKLYQFEGMVPQLKLVTDNKAYSVHMALKFDDVLNHVENNYRNMVLHGLIEDASPVHFMVESIENDMALVIENYVGKLNGLLCYPTAVIEQATEFPGMIIHEVNLYQPIPDQLLAQAHQEETNVVTLNIPTPADMYELKNVLTLDKVTGSINQLMADPKNFGWQQSVLVASMTLQGQLPPEQQHTLLQQMELAGWKIILSVRHQRKVSYTTFNIIPKE